MNFAGLKKRLVIRPLSGYADEWQARHPEHSDQREQNRFLEYFLHRNLL